MLGVQGKGTSLPPGRLGRDRCQHRRLGGKAGELPAADLRADGLIERR